MRQVCQLLLCVAFIEISCSCASLPAAVRDSDPCQVAAEMAPMRRWADPCSAADMIAQCAGLAAPERRRIASACAAELARTRRE